MEYKKFKIGGKFLMTESNVTLTICCHDFNWQYNKSKIWVHKDVVKNVKQEHGEFVGVFLFSD